MKVLMLADANSSHTLKWVRSLIDHKVQILLFSLYRDTEKGIEDLVSSGALELELGEHGYSGSILDAKFTRSHAKLRKIIRHFKPDILHAQYASSYGLLGALSGFKPYVISVWGSDVYAFPRKNFIFKQILKYNLSKCNLILSSSFVMKDETEKYTNKEVQVISFGVDIDSLLPRTQNNRDHITIGTVKKLEHIYGIDILIKAFAITVKKLPELDIRLSLVGGGILLEPLQDLANDLGVLDKVDFHGKVDHEKVHSRLLDMDVFAALSREESFGVSILEAMSCGLPVVVSDAPGPAEIVEDKKDGFIVPKEDHEAAALRLIELASSEELRNMIGAAARQSVVEKYNWEENVVELIDAYKKLI